MRNYSYRFRTALALVSLLFGMEGSGMMPGEMMFFYGTGPTLPYDAEVEWIKSSGGAYIDTGLNLSLSSFDWTVDIAFGKAIGYSTHQFMFGAVYSGDMCGVSQGLYFVVRPNWHPSAMLQHRFDPNERIAVRFTRDNGITTLYVNGETEATSNESLVADTGRLCLLGSELSQYPQATYPYVLYGVSSANNDFELVPVRFTNELGQSEGAMYDRVSKKLFRNQGTGAFVIGSDKA
jgi:hypothetical protein